MGKQETGPNSNTRIIKLNVGGQHFTTLESTLCQSPYFEALCSGKFGDEMSEDGEYFIDRDGGMFKYLLNFLCCGYVEIPTASASTLHQEALYFQIPLDLTHIIKKMQRRKIVLKSEDKHVYWVRSIPKGSPSARMVLLSGDGDEKWTKNLYYGSEEWNIKTNNLSNISVANIIFNPIDHLINALVNEGGYRIVATSEFVTPTERRTRSGTATTTIYVRTKSVYLEPLVPQTITVTQGSQ